MTVRTIHIREMLDQAQHLAGSAARLAAMAETTLPGMEKVQRTELERAIVLADRAAGLAEHAKAELRDELFRATHGDDIDARLLVSGWGEVQEAEGDESGRHWSAGIDMMFEPPTEPIAGPTPMPAHLAPSRHKQGQ